MVKLDQNENPYPLSKELREEVNNLAAEVAFNRYPDKTYPDLRDALSKYTNYPADKIICGNGSDELILLLHLVYGGGDSVMISPTPTFGMYSYYAEVVGTEIIEISYRQDDGRPIFPEEEILETASLFTQGLIFICSPNNPTGEKISLSWLSKLLGSTDLMVVVDEAYFEFSDLTAKDLISNNDNLIVLRTLSKAFGLAGLRIGYLLTNDKNIEPLSFCRSPYNISNYSAEVAVKLLNKKSLFRKQWQTIKKERAKLEKFFTGLPGLRYYPSEGNYIMFQTEEAEEKVKDKLLERNVKIRFWPNLPVFGSTLRVSVGLPAENNKFKLELADIIGGGENG
ncbi:MAG: histidinol-phosphate transaminase [Bacillota bacterium]